MVVEGSTIGQPMNLNSDGSVWKPDVYIIPQEMYCPKCNHEFRSDAGIIVYSSLPEYEGTYCEKCFAKWASENLGKGVPK